MTTTEALAQNSTLTVAVRIANLIAAAMVTSLVLWGWTAADRISKLETATAVIQATQAQSTIDRKEFQDQTGSQLNAINKTLVDLSNSTSALNATITQMARR